MLHRLYKLRHRAADQKGFTLIELLVVILIIGILAAIAIPSFLGQRSKAQDSAAKADTRSAATAMETYYTDNQTYLLATPAKLQAIEPTLNDANALVTTPAPTATQYTVTTTSKSADLTKFSITRAATGRTTRTCDKPDKGGCRKAPTGAGGVW